MALPRVYPLGHDGQIQGGEADRLAECECGLPHPTSAIEEARGEPSILAGAPEHLADTPERSRRLQAVRIISFRLALVVVPYSKLLALGFGGSKKEES